MIRIHPLKVMGYFPPINKVGNTHLNAGLRSLMYPVTEMTAGGIQMLSGHSPLNGEGIHPIKSSQEH